MIFSYLQVTGWNLYLEKGKVNTAYESTISIESALSTEIMTFIQSKYVTITRRQEYEQQD